MALNADVLTALIQSNVVAATGNEMPAPALVVWGAVAKAIVEHITTLAVVEVSVASATALTPGVPGVGVGVIT